jgi:hypothetical protein
MGRMNFALFRPAGKKYIALADIGSGSVGVAIAEKAPGTCVIVSVARATLPIEKRGRDQLLTGVIGKLEEAGKQALKDAIAKRGSVVVNDAYVIVRAPWCRSSVPRVVADYDTDVKVTEKILADLAHDALNEVKAQSGASSLEAAVMRVELNGYPTPKPEGKRARSVAVSALVSYCDGTLREKTEPVLQSLFPAAKIAWRSAVRALTTVVREAGIQSEEYVIADVESEGTDFCVIKSGILQTHMLAPFGTRAMIGKIAPDGVPEDTITSIRHVIADQCEDDACKTVAENMAKAEPGFARSFGEVLGKDLPRTRLPSTLVLLSSGDLSAWLGRFFGRIDFSQFTVMLQPFSVVELTESDIDPLIGGYEPKQRDIGLELAAALVNIEDTRQ